MSPLKIKIYNKIQSYNHYRLQILLKKIILYFILLDNYNVM